MIRTGLGAALACVWLAGSSVRADEAEQPVDQDPVLRVEAGGPTAFVAGLAFGPDERTLYAGGHDKVVHTWVFDAERKQFAAGELTYRVPVGPGIDGSINAVALSPDGVWLAAGGRGRVRGVSGFGKSGVWIPALTAMSDAMWLDQGTVYVFNTRDRSVRQLRGHRGPVVALAFAVGRPGKSLVLVSAAREAGAQGYGGKVRAWDVEASKELGQLGALPDLLDPTKPGHVRLPRLAAWTGERPEQVHVGVAWEDGNFRLWEPGAEKPEVREDGPGNNTVAVLADRERYITGSVTAKGGALKLWRAGKALTEAALPGETPLVVAVLPGKTERLAVVSEQGADTLLQLYDLPGLKPSRDKPIKLWSGPRRIAPALAVSAAGRFLAVSGNPDHGVHLFAVADLLDAKEPRPQVLHGVGAPPHSVAFVAKDKGLGLALGATPKELVFDLEKRILGDRTDGWKTDAPNTEGWSVEAEKGLPSRYRVQHPKKGAWTVHLRPNQTPSATALLPPRKENEPPLLAVAVVELGQPLLGLYDVRQDALVRQYVGHSKTIRGLAFTADGRLLASVADDQTVCVWGLADVDRVIGKRGSLRALAVKAVGKTVEVAALDLASLSAADRKKLEDAGVAPGTVVEGFVEGGKLRHTESAADFYFGVDGYLPGKPLTLRFKGKGDIPLTVAQGADEHKPLFSLFVAESGGQRRWVGWNPIGPYDRSDDEAEKLLGWLTSTADPTRPVNFAPAGEYRALNFKPGILRHLAVTASTPAACQAWAIDNPARAREPKMTLWFQELGADLPYDSRGRVIVTKPNLTLKLTLQEPPAGGVQAVRWKVAGGAGGAMEPSGDLEWSADLSGVDWKRGDFTLRVTLQAAGRPPQEYARELVLHYQPARPLVRLLKPAPRVAEQEEFLFEAEVVPAVGQTAQIRVQHVHDGKELLKRPVSSAKETAKVEQKLKLEPGVNRVRLSAVNEGGDETNAAEAEALIFEILYKAPRPQITLTAVEPEGGAEVRLDPSGEDAVVVVDASRVRIVGEVEALGKLTEASWTIADGKPQAVALGKEARQPLRVEVSIPGTEKPLDVKFRAKTAGGGEAERSIRLKYEPRLPEARITAPVAGQPFVEGRDRADNAVVRCRLRWPADAHRCTAVVLIDSGDGPKEQGPAVAVAAGAEEALLTAKLRPGENNIQVRFKNDWREMTTPRVLVNYRRPPRVALDGPRKVAVPFADLVARVESTREITLVRVRIGGSETTPKAAVPMAVERKGDVQVYKIALADLPLRQGANLVEVEAANADGWSLEPARFTVELEKPPPPPAEVSLFNPEQDRVSDAEGQIVDFRVRSQSPLKRVELQRDGATIYRVTDLETLHEVGGVYEVRESCNVDLQPGANEVRVVAVNEGGELASRPILITYQPEPIRVTVGHLEVAGAKIEGLTLADGRLSFPDVGQEEAVLHGKVTWGRSSDAALTRAKQVRVYLNGCQQTPAELTPVAGVRARTFRIKLRLQRGDNQVAVKLPEAAEEAGSRNRCVVVCTAASSGAIRRQAHVLVIDTAHVAPAEAVDRVAAALQAQRGGENRLTKPGFDDGVRIYGPLVGDEVTPERVYVQLLNIKRNLRLRSAAGAGGDVVFLYFRGGETVDASGHFLRTSDGDRDPELRWSGIPCDYLTRFFADNLGAQVVLLDVDRTASPNGAGDARDQVARWSEDANLAVCRYAWRGPKTGAGPRLLDDWSDAVKGGARTLRQVADRVAQVRKQPGALTLSWQVAPALQTLAVGGP